MKDKHPLVTAFKAMPKVGSHFVLDMVGGTVVYGETRRDPTTGLTLTRAPRPINERED